VERISERFENAREVCEETLEKDEDLRSWCIGAPFMRDGALRARCTEIDDQEKKRGGRVGRANAMTAIFAKCCAKFLRQEIRTYRYCSSAMHLARRMLVHCVPSPRHVVAIYVVALARAEHFIVTRDVSSALPTAIGLEERDGRTEVTNCDFSIEQADE